MAFGNVTALYLPVAANAGASQWGSDVRKLLAATDAANDVTSTLSHAALSTTTRTVDPYTAATADLAQTDYGWAVAPSDMNSVAGALRFYPAGNHVLTARLKTNQTLGGNCTLFFFIYRVGPATDRTRTLLDSASAVVALPTLGAYVTGTVTVALGEIIFEADETLQYGFEVSRAATTAEIITFDTGTNSVAIRVDTPRLGVLADTTGTASGTGTPAGSMSKVLGAIGAAAGAATAVGTGASIGSATGTAAGAVTVAGQMSSVFSFAGTAAGVATAAGQTSIVLGTVGTCEIGSSAAQAGTYSRGRLVNQRAA